MYVLLDGLASFLGGLVVAFWLVFAFEFVLVWGGWFSWWVVVRCCGGWLVAVSVALYGCSLIVLLFVLDLLDLLLGCMRLFVYFD